MELIIRNTTNQPIYEQIYTQIKALILSGQLQPGEALQVRLFDGMLLCTVDECRPADKTLFKPRG